MMMNGPKPSGLSADRPQAMIAGTGILVLVLTKRIVCTSLRTFSSPFMTLPGTAKRTSHRSPSSNLTTQLQLNEPHRLSMIAHGWPLRYFDTHLATSDSRALLNLADHRRD